MNPGILVESLCGAAALPAVWLSSLLLASVGCSDSLPCTGVFGRNSGILAGSQQTDEHMVLEFDSSGLSSQPGTWTSETLASWTISIFCCGGRFGVGLVGAEGWGRDSRAQPFWKSTPGQSSSSGRAKSIIS